MEHRKLVAVAYGAVGDRAVGVATLSFGFKLTGSSTSAGVVTTALAFGFVLLVLAYTLGPISGCHVNPAVTFGFFGVRSDVHRRSGRLLGRPVRRRHHRRPDPVGHLLQCTHV